MLVEGRFEPAIAQSAAFQPVRREAAHLVDHRLAVDVGRPEDFQRARRSAAFGEGGALQHHRARISPRHPEVGRIGAGVDPDALAEWPAVTRPVVGPIAFHLDHAIVEVELEPIDEPAAELAECQAMPHRHRTGADEAFPAREERQPFDRPTGGIGPVEHPDRFLVLGRCLEHVEQGRDEGVDAAAEVLHVDQQHVERAHRLAGGTPHLAIEAEYGDVVHRIGEILRLHHIVLLVAAHAVLRAESGRELEIAKRAERIERMGEVGRHRGGMGEQGHALALERGAKRGIGEETIDAEFHGDAHAMAGRWRTKPSSWWKSALPGGWASAQ